MNGPACWLEFRQLSYLETLVLTRIVTLTFAVLVLGGARPLGGLVATCFCPVLWVVAVDLWLDLPDVADPVGNPGPCLAAAVLRGATGLAEACSLPLDGASLDLI